MPNPSPYGMAMLEDDLLTRGVLLRRLVAWWIDALLIAALASIAWTLGLMFVVLTLGLGLPLLAGLPSLGIIYTWLTIASPLSATPGQALLGLTVRRNDDLTRPTLAQALVFAVGYWLTLMTGVIWLGVALLTVRRRTLHDLVSGLVVVRERALTPPAGSWNMPPGGWPPR
ncbi:MAG: hypothetical protein BGP12_05800 [Rhodospirillales bacterium 70-18]|nr:MAG: hypothetical protein BGP12_05800 [Rhodospirillales bacterium 70-18]